MIYFHTATITTASGTSSTLTLNIPHGLCQQVLIRALTSATTTFSANLTESSKALRVVDWGFYQQEINSLGLHLPLAGVYQLNITNASAADTFSVLVGVEEG